jgi:hypothetical protein
VVEVDLLSRPPEAGSLAVRIPTAREVEQCWHLAIYLSSHLLGRRNGGSDVDRVDYQGTNAIAVSILSGYHAVPVTIQRKTFKVLGWRVDRTVRYPGWCREDSSEDVDVPTEYHDILFAADTMEGALGYICLDIQRQWLADAIDDYMLAADQPTA